VDDLLDQLERVLRGETEPDERDVRLFPGRHCSDGRDVDLAGDHLVPEACDYLGEQLEPVASFVGDQDAQVLNLVLDHPPRSPRGIFYPNGRCRIARRKPLRYPFCAGSRAAQS
jgi:hypothetical protein